MNDVTVSSEPPVDVTVKIQIVLAVIDNYNTVGRVCACVCVQMRVKL